MAETLIGPGKLVLVVGPSGAGKDTLIGLAKARSTGNDRIVFPQRTVTRPSSSFEDNLVMSPDEFDAALQRQEFALHWRAHGHAYGIPRAIDDELRLGKIVIVNVSRTVVAEARRRYVKVIVALVTAPADVLAQRLAARDRPSDGSVSSRLQRADLDADFVADVVIDNVGEAESNARRLLEAISRTD
jgi:ribose 1,5-bisphosphokinase